MRWRVGGKFGAFRKGMGGWDVAERRKAAGRRLVRRLASSQGRLASISSCKTGRGKFGTTRAVSSVKTARKSSVTVCQPSFPWSSVPHR